jgi:hypothetical protein
VFAPAAAATRRPLNLAGVLQPLADLRLAGGLALGAVARLATGVARLALALALVRRPAACCSHGAAG